MSGICAVWQKDDPRRAGTTLAAMAAGLSLCDAERLDKQVEAGVGLGVSARFVGQQIHNNGRVAVVCDTELCGEQDLRTACGLPTSAGNTAALLAALYERHGDDFVEKLRGNFSLILWDREARKLLAAIDGFGVKRLAYYETSTVLVVASRIDALVRSGEVDTAVNPRTIVDVLNFTTPAAPETAFRHVFRIMPGALLLATAAGTHTRPYWDMRYRPDEGATEEALSRELEQVVETAVRECCQSAGQAEVGAFLSGGTDSSTVVGLMDRAGARPVKAFSIGFREQPFNELEYAAITARKFGAKHHTYLVSPDDCLEALPRMVRAFDEPFANASAIPTYFCARLAAQTGTKVLLAGDGGDELFGGNERYATDRIFDVYQEVPRFVRKGFIEPALRVLPSKLPLIAKARSYVRRSNIPALDRYFSYQFLCAHAPGEVLDPDLLSALDGYSVLDVPSRYYREAPAAAHLDRLLYVDVKMTLGDSDLPKVTCMSELAGITTLFPFLDRTVAEFSGRMPPRLKVKGFDKRYLFKRAFRNLLPPEVIRKKKHGFGIPVANWLKTDSRLRELSRDTLFSSRAFGRGYFRRQFIEELFRQYETDDSTYYGDTVWTFLVLELWHRQFVDEAAKVSA